MRTRICRFINGIDFVYFDSKLCNSGSFVPYHDVKIKISKGSKMEHKLNK